MKPAHTLLAIAMLALLVAGCDRANNPAPASAPDSGAEAPEAPAPATEIVTNDMLPPGVTLGVVAAQRSTHVYVTQAGQSRRVVNYEFLEGDAAGAAAALQQSMENAGFVAKLEPQRADGKVRTTFRKAGYGRVNGAVDATVPATPKDPAAKGILTLDFPAAGQVSG